MLGLAKMAWNLAWYRAYSEKPAGTREPFPRGSGGFASQIYYVIIDRIARGEKP